MGLLICALLLQKEGFCSLMSWLQLVDVAICSSKARLEPGKFAAANPVLGCIVEGLRLQRAMRSCFAESTSDFLNGSVLVQFFDVPAAWLPCAMFSTPLRAAWTV